jgi:hypothetical protein
LVILLCVSHASNPPFEFLLVGPSPYLKDDVPIDGVIGCIPRLEVELKERVEVFIESYNTVDALLYELI